MSAHVDPKLLEDAFWEFAFDRNEPFRTEYVTEFRRGIVEGSENDLAWARMAIYGISDGALWPIILRLVDLGVSRPRAEFVESLAFFLSSEQALSRLREGSGCVTPHDLSAALHFVSELQKTLTDQGEHDLAQRLRAFRDLVSGVAGVS